MENKYYIPSIEEFYVGFEFERLRGIPEFWEKQTVERFFEIDYLFENELANIRVKYLDKEDIESCGFKHLGFLWFENLGCLTSNGENYLDCRIRMWKDNEIDIYNWNKGHENGTSDIIFRGTIKNLSELKQEFNRLNINIK